MTGVKNFPAQWYRDRIAALEEQLRIASAQVDLLLGQSFQLDASRRAWASAAADVDRELARERELRRAVSLPVTH